MTAEGAMSRNPSYSRAGANGGYTNGNYNNGEYANADNANGDRSSDDRRRRPGGYGGINPAENDSVRRPSNDRERERRPGGYGGISREADFARQPSGGSDRDRDRERRPGGYGGYGGLSPRDEDPPHVARPTSIERSQARRRSGSRPNAAGVSYGPGSQRIEQVLQYIMQNWDFMTKDKCVPIEVALKLMDSSSLGLANQAGQFRQTHDELQQALKGIVNGRLSTTYLLNSHLMESQNIIRASTAPLAHSIRFRAAYKALNTV